MKRFFNTLLICSCAITTLVHAAIPNVIQGPGYAYYVRLGLGGTKLSTNQNQTVNPGPGWPDDLYISQNSLNNAARVSIGAGVNVITRSPCYIPYYSIGLDYTYGWNQTIRGKIWQYSLPEFENYNFRYQIQRNTFMLSGKLDLIDFFSVMPYVVGGVGYSFNRGVSYHESALPGVTPRISPGFRGTTNGYVSYIYGIGIDVIANENWWLSLEYTRGSFGKIRTGNGQDITTLTGFNYSDSHLQNNLNNPQQLVFYITYMPYNL